jgi:hypothetical protein
MNKSKIMIALRKGNGQIGYLSEGLEIPEFFELICSKDNKKILVDYSLIIEKLHEIHQKNEDMSIINKFNTLYNYWQDAKTYTKESLKFLKSEELSKLSNSLIVDLQNRLKDNYNSFYGTQDNCKTILYKIRDDCNIYIDTLLCFIHSKASLEIESFQRDSILTSYGMFIQEIISELYKFIINKGNYRESFFKFLAFQSPNDLQSHLDLTNTQESLDEFLLRTLKTEKPYDYFDDYHGNIKQVSIQYDNFDYDQINLAQLLRDLMYKIRSINKLLFLLKEGQVEWDERGDIMNSLPQLLD